MGVRARCRGTQASRGMGDGGQDTAGPASVEAELSLEKSGRGTRPRLYPRGEGALKLLPGLLITPPPPQPSPAHAPPRQLDKRISIRKIRKGKRLERLPLFYGENPGDEGEHPGAL